MATAFVAQTLASVTAAEGTVLQDTEKKLVTVADAQSNLVLRPYAAYRFL